VTPTKPEFTITQPTVQLCSSATTGGSVNFCTTNSNYTYKVGDKTAVNGTGGAVSVGGLAAGSNPSIVVSDSRFSGCSASFSCSDAVTSCSTSTGSVTRTASVTSESTLAETTVKAYPNPFSDKLKFVVTTPVAGRGNLEVYNMMGQKIKTVYQGFINKGTQTFELSLPAQQISNLVYVLRIGDKKMSGKLLQINQ
jgi:hypothetical protein